MTRIKTNSVETFFDDEGSGPAVVFLHGFPFNRSMWRDQFEALKGHRMIAPDLRGLGETVADDAIATMDQMAHDVAALLDALQLERAVVCGLSMGGYVALEFCHFFPERVNGLVLAGTRAPADNAEEKQNRERQATRLLAEGMKGIADETLPKLLARETLAGKAEVVNRVRQMIDSTDPRGAAAAQRGMAARRDYSAGLARINVPTLVVVGREDTIRPLSDAQFMHDNIRKSRLEVIENAAHVSNMEQPGVFNAAFSQFLSQLGQND